MAHGLSLKMAEIQPPAPRWISRGTNPFVHEEKRQLRAKQTEERKAKPFIEREVKWPSFDNYLLGRIADAKEKVLRSRKRWWRKNQPRTGAHRVERLFAFLRFVSE